MGERQYFLHATIVVTILFVIFCCGIFSRNAHADIHIENEIDPGDSGNSGDPGDSREVTNDFMTFMILAGVFLIAGGIMASLVKRDVGKRNMNVKKWSGMLLGFVIMLPIACVYFILFYNLTTFEGSLMFGVSYFCFFGPYLYVRRRSIYIVEQVPTEFEIKLSSAYRDIFAFGLVIAGVVMMIFSTYHFIVGNIFLGKVIITVAIPVGMVGVILVKIWFSFNKIKISTREIKIEQNNKAKIIKWDDVAEIIFYRQVAPFMVLDLPGYHKKVGQRGSERAIKIVSRKHSLEFKDKDLPSEEDFRIIFFILLYHKKRSNPEAKINFKAQWAKKWYHEYKRYIINSS